MCLSRWLSNHKADFLSSTIKQKGNSLFIPSHSTLHIHPVFSCWEFSTHTHIYFLIHDDSSTAQPVPARSQRKPERLIVHLWRISLRRTCLADALEFTAFGDVAKRQVNTSSANHSFFLFVFFFPGSGVNNNEARRCIVIYMKKQCELLNGTWCTFPAFAADVSWTEANRRDSICEVSF